ncbi:DUF975 family protein [Streptococcus macacae]|uniref:PF06161 family protein n=1 Tax=Streptococcus macacae NCTC 11558 TaxID=764298 RepID=G5JWQ0_9STRE|nr:DUF975 family protein [Streptococcus macacae]EHJ53165.1 hypothetical protein STRMA_1186 [Streptococcus macacae NCTC 11558]SUN79010.1 membrane protein [Streptococcus macacae NCTC 11558]
MLKTRAELKTEAKARLKGNWAYAVGLSALPYLTMLAIGLACAIVCSVLAASLFMSLTPLVASLIFVPPLIIIYLALLVMMFTVEMGISLGFLDFFRGSKPTYTSASTYILRKNRFWKFFWTNIIMAIFLYLWTILFIVPGIIKGYGYVMTNYILKDKLERGEEVTVTQAITESRRLMQGHKWEYFVLQLSFLGWMILALLTFNIGFLWLVPYMQTTNSAFYQNLRDNS